MKLPKIAKIKSKTFETRRNGVAGGTWGFVFNPDPELAEVERSLFPPIFDQNRVPKAFFGYMWSLAPLGISEKISLRLLALPKKSKSHHV